MPEDHIWAYKGLSVGMPVLGLLNWETHLVNQDEMETTTIPLNLANQKE